MEMIVAPWHKRASEKRQTNLPLRDEDTSGAADFIETH